jgi:4'-phosphopantetheinyl transferase
MLIIYYSKLSGELPDARYEEYLSGLPLSLQQKNRKYRNWQDKLLNLFGKLLLIEALRQFNIDSNCLNALYYNSYGRPYVSDTIDFNISHSGEYVICAAAKNIRLGLDVEIIKPVDFPDFENTMTVHEWNDIKASGNQLKAFFRHWVIKESVIKADSRGLSIPLQNIVINPDSAECLGKRWHWRELMFDDAYCACLATERPVADVMYKLVLF